MTVAAKVLIDINEGAHVSGCERLHIGHTQVAFALARLRCRCLASTTDFRLELPEAIMQQLHKEAMVMSKIRHLNVSRRVWCSAMLPMLTVPHWLPMFN